MYCIRLAHYFWMFVPILGGVYKKCTSFGDDFLKHPIVRPIVVVFSYLVS
jgi:hypothetical protein